MAVCTSWGGRSPTVSSDTPPHRAFGGRGRPGAWSGGQLEPAAVLFQREVVTATDPGAVIDGVHVDVDDVLAPDFGQWDLAR